MSSNLDQIRDQQRQTWDRLSSGWKKWDEAVLAWLSPFREAMIRHANLKQDSRVLDLARGAGEPGVQSSPNPEVRWAAAPRRINPFGGTRHRSGS